MGAEEGCENRIMGLVKGGREGYRGRETDERDKEREREWGIRREEKGGRGIYGAAQGIQFRRNDLLISAMTSALF